MTIYDLKCSSVQLSLDLTWLMQHMPLMSQFRHGLGRIYPFAAFGIWWPRFFKVWYFASRWLVSSTSLRQHVCPNILSAPKLVALITISQGSACQTGVPVFFFPHWGYSPRKSRISLDILLLRPIMPQYHGSTIRLLPSALMTAVMAFWKMAGAKFCRNHHRSCTAFQFPPSKFRSCRW